MLALDLNPSRPRGLYLRGVLAAHLICLAGLGAAPTAQIDTTPPTIVARSPMPGATGVSPRVSVQVTFDEAIAEGTLTMQLRNSANQLVAATVAYHPATRSATLDPTSDLTGSQTYAVSVSGGRDAAGNTMTGVNWSFTTGTEGFQDIVLPQTGLNDPTVIAFSPDGRIFVAEKGGRVLGFDSLQDATPSTVIDISQNVHDYWDRGLLGMALHPQFPDTPYIYLLYSHDAIPGGTAPRWGDTCPNPPGDTVNGCVITGRLARYNVGNGSAWPLGPAAEEVLITDWFQQFPSHSVGSLAFGADGALYASAGDGASFNYADYGQTPSTPPANDPVNEGGALRSQDIRTAGDPVAVNGAVVRLDPNTGAALPDNPRMADPDANGKRLIAHGLRNPFRFTVKPGTNELWVADVGWGGREAIHRIVDATDSFVENFGWPCYEAGTIQAGYDSLDLRICETLYGQPGAITPPYFRYHHSDQIVAGEACPKGSSSVSGVAFYPQAASGYPASYRGALFFADYSRNCIWAMRSDANGQPNTGDIVTIKSGAGGPVHLVSGPDGDIFYAGLNDDRLHRIVYTTGNQPPSARAAASVTSGPLPLQVSFAGTGSSDPEGQALSYAWDLDGDGQFDDSVAASPTYTYTEAGAVTVRLRVTDAAGLSDVAASALWPGNTAPSVVIDQPSTGIRWSVGDSIAFSGRGTDDEDGALGGTSLEWTLVVQHCPSNCHVHPLQTFTGAAGTFSAPDHEYPSHLELTLTATDAGGLKSSRTIALNPKTVQLSFATSPSGLQLSMNGSSASAPFTREVIAGSSNSVAAPTPQQSGTDAYGFDKWSDNGAAVHNVVAPATNATYTATYIRQAFPASLVAAWAFDELTGSTTRDVTGRGHAGTLSNAAWSANGKFGGALSFAGNGLVRVADAADLDLTTGMTIEAWVMPTQLSGWRTIALKERANDLAFALYAHDGVARPAGYIYNGGQRRAVGTAAPALNTWTHLATTYDGGTLRIFVNGVQAGAVATAGAISVTTGELTIGGNDVWLDEFFTGSIDEVRIYNRALTATEIQADMTMPLGGPPPPDTTAPAVSITVPANNAFVRGTLTITADATDTGGVSSVQFVVDGTPLGPADTQAPFTASWSTAGLTGTHTVSAIAIDIAGNSATSNAIVVVVDNDPPGIALTSPVGGPVSGTITLAANATDPNGIASVQFQADGANVGAADTTAPFSVSWNTAAVANGTHSITAIATDRAGNTAMSAAATVTVSNTWVAPAGLVAAYTFSEGTGAVAADASGNGLAGALNGGVAWVASGRFGNAVNFNGTSGMISVADVPALDFTTSLTIEAWVRPTSLSGWNTIALKGGTSNSLAYGLYANDNTPRPAGYVQVGSTTRSAAGTAAIPLNTWTHLAMTYDGTIVRLFVNGTQVGSRSISGTLRQSAANLEIGGNSIWAEWFSGAIDEVRIYNRALTQAEIQAGMGQTLGGS